MIKAIRLCRGAMERYQVDLVNTHSSRDSWIASISGRLSSRRPTILRTRHLSIPVRSDPVSRFLYRCLPHGVITTGEVIRKELMEKLGIDGERVSSIPTGVDVRRFNPEEIRGALREALGLESEGLLVGTVSVLRGWKGHLDFLEAAAGVVKRVPLSSFVIVGEGPMRTLIEEGIERLGLDDRVRLLGFREDIPEILVSLDLFVHPSFKHEGVPQVLLQAMAMERAVVASDIGGIREVVRDGVDGLLVPPRDPGRLAEGMVRLLLDPEKRYSMGKRGREQVLQKWTLEKMVEKTIGVYERLIKARGFGGWDR
jgi:glycosyltransferase involved in cell wall biosynthesis